MPHPSFAAGETLPASKLRALAVRDSYTPALTASTTNPNLGTIGRIETGEFYVTGNMVWVFLDIMWGTGGTAGTGTYRISLPLGFPIDSAFTNSSTPLPGWLRLRDNSAPAEDTWVPYTQSGGLVSIRNESSPNTQEVASNVPWTWAASDRIRGCFTYLTSE